MMKKSNYFALASLLVLGYAAVKAFPQEPEQNAGETFNPDSNVFAQSTPSEAEVGGGAGAGGGQNNFVLDGNDNADASTTPIPLFDSVSEVRLYVVSKIQEIYSMLKGRTTKVDIEQATRLDFEHLPKFEDPLYIGNFTKKYKLADVSFSDVKVIGMQNFHSADMKTDTSKRSVDLYLTADNLRIVGHYFLSNFFKKTSGPFIVKLINNVTYHESSVYCRLKNEVDIAAAHCGMRYGKSDNDYRDLGFFTQLFRSAISCPMIDEVLQKVGKEIGHKMRPILLSKLHEIVLGVSNVAGLETLIRSSVSEARNLMMRDEYQNFLLEGDVDKVQYGTHDSTIQSINLSNMHMFEITQIDTPITGDRIAVKAVLHNTNVNGTTNVEFVENELVGPKLSNNGPTVVTLAFDVRDLSVDITLEKALSNDEDRFVISKLEVTATDVTTHPPQDQTYPAQIDAALRNFLPERLRKLIGARFSDLAKTNIEDILAEAF